MQSGSGYGPITSIDGATSTGGGSWVKPPASVFDKWAYHVKTAGSTSTVTATYRLEGTLSESTAPAAADIYTISTGAGGGVVHLTGKIARQVRVNLLSISSTSSTAPSATAVVAAAQ